MNDIACSITVKYGKLHRTKPRDYLLVPWPFVISRFYCTLNLHFNSRSPSVALWLHFRALVRKGMAISPRRGSPNFFCFVLLFFCCFMLVYYLFFRLNKGSSENNFTKGPETQLIIKYQSSHIPLFASYASLLACNQIRPIRRFIEGYMTAP